MSDRREVQEEAEWRPVTRPGPVAEWTGAGEAYPEDDPLVADLPTPLERCRRAWRAACAAEREAGTAFVAAPLALAAGIAFYFAVPVEPVGGAALPILLGALVALRGRHGAARLGWMSLMLVALGFSLAQARVLLLSTPMLDRPTVGVVTGQVVWTERRAQGVRYTIAVDGVSSYRTVRLDKARVTVRKDHVPLAPGDRMTLRARLMPPGGPVVPGGYDFAFFAWFSGRGADGSGLDPPVRLKGGEWLGLPLTLARWRYQIGRRIDAAMDGRTGPLARALVIGDRSGIDDNLSEDLRASGLAHILAISGLHMMLVTGLIFAALRKVCAVAAIGSQKVAVKKYAAVGAFVAGSVYLLLSGLNVSTQRAYVMVCVMLLAVLLDRRALTLHNVAIAAFVVLALQPEALFAPGFQMSFGAATALVAAYGGVRRWRSGREAAAGTLAGGVRWLGGLSFTSLVAGFATAPFAAFHFHRIAAYGLVANLLAMPVVTFLVMPLAVLSVLAMPFGADAWLLPLLGWSLDLVAAISGWVAGWEGWARTGHVGLPAFVLAVAGFCALAVMTTWLRAFGSVGLAAAALAYTLQPEPVVLIHEDARHAATLGAHPAYLAGKPTSFVNKLFAEAHRPAGFTKEQRAACDRSGCAARIDGTTWLALSRLTESLPDDCERATILVTWAPSACGAAVRPLIVSRRSLRRRGSAAIYDLGADRPVTERWRVVHAHGASPRPWTAHRHRTQ